MDLFGPVNIMSIGKKKYCLVIVDDFTRYSLTFFLHSKDEVSQVIINQIKAVDKFKNSLMKNFCDEKGITHTFSSPRTPQQNGVVERKNRTLIKASRTMFEESKLPTYLWAEVINNAYYTQNVSIVNQAQTRSQQLTFFMSLDASVLYSETRVKIL